MKFDPMRRAKSPALRSALAALATYLEAREVELRLRTRARKEADRRKFRLAVEVIGCNLLMAKWLANDGAAVPGPIVEIYRGLSRIARVDAHRPEVYGIPFLDALDLMSHPDVGLAEQTQGHLFETGAGQPSTLSAKPSLWHRLPLSSFHPSDLEQPLEEEVLFLKGPKPSRNGGGELEGRSRPQLPLPETRHVKSMRNEVLRLNARLFKADIQLIDSDDGGPRFGLNREDRPLDPTQRSLKRHFTNGSLRQGGRLFGGFWQQMGREDRLRRLMIDGERVGDVDYGQLYPRLCYALESLPQPLGDLYAIPGFEKVRAGIKKLFNAMLFAETPLKRWPSDTLDLFPNGSKLADIIDAIGELHPAIAHRFGTGFGFTLMAAESAMLLSVLRSLFAQGITALPIHDAVMVAAPHAETAKNAMLMAFNEFEGFRDIDPEQSRGLVEIEYPADFCGFCPL